MYILIWSENPYLVVGNYDDWILLWPAKIFYSLYVTQFHCDIHPKRTQEMEGFHGTNAALQMQMFNDLFALLVME